VPGRERDASWAWTILRAGEHFSLLVGTAGPEEAAEAVLAFAGDDVDMKMGHALADDVVDSDEAAFCFHYLLHFSGEHLNVSEKRPITAVGDQTKWVVRLRNQQDVAGEKRANVEETKEISSSKIILASTSRETILQKRQDSSWSACFSSDSLRGVIFSWAQD